MKQIKKKRIVELAKQSGLVYNMHLEGFKIFPHHLDAIWEFYLLIEKELKNAEANPESNPVQGSPDSE